MDDPVFASDTISFLQSHSQEVTMDRLTAAVQYITGDKRGSSCDSEVEAHLSSLLCSLYQRKQRPGDVVELLRSQHLPATVGNLVGQHWEAISAAMDQGKGSMNSTIFVPRLCDVTWNTAYVLGSGRLRHVMEPVCTASLKVANADGQLEGVNFEVSKEQLSTILYKLKAANAQIEKLLG